MQTSRRDLLLAMAGLLPLACATRGAQSAIDGTVPRPQEQAVRAAAVGQRWEYRVRNVYNDLTVDEYAESVIAVGAQVRIRRDARGVHASPEEVHAPWGMILCDPHWDPPIAFARPLPAWPVDLASTGVEDYDRHYHTLGSPDYPLGWSLQMRPMAWERITVPAGTFDALRFDNHINFESDDFWRVESTRDESVWLCPEVGRWVRRISHGTYYLPGPGGGEMHEDYRQADLLRWQ